VAARNTWTASGFVGASFETTNNVAADVLDADTDETASMTFGGQVSYLWRNYIGGEFIADFAPTVKISNVLFAKHPRVNSYMANVIAMAPLGADDQFQPYISGGVGGITLHTELFTPLGLLTGINQDTTTTSSNVTRFGSDIGGGVLAFAGRVGLRADVRYYRSSTNNSIDDILTGEGFANSVTEGLLSGLRFWRASLGVSFR
jgi:hypothetical protein